MLKPNTRYKELKDTYLFNTIYRKTNEYLEANPDDMENEEIITAARDMQILSDIRGSIPVFCNRRPELY